VPKCSIYSQLQQKLEERKKHNIYRSLENFTGLIDFASNDYLGFSRSLQLSNSVTSNGSTGSRLISGNCNESIVAEKIIAGFHGFESALIYTSGYTANVGLLQCIADRGDTFISDELVHASLIDGMRLSQANRLKFKHNDIEDLKSKLGKATGKVFVVVESVYSMDGDIAPMKSLVNLKDNFDFELIVDEAHAVGVFGEKGEGLVSSLKLQQHIFACVYTFGKALGLHGAAIAGTELLKNYLINFSRSFIYTTALPPSAYGHITEAYNQQPFANRNLLFENISYFKSQLLSVSNIETVESISPIQAIIIGDIEKAKEIASKLIQVGIYAKAIVSPTVPKGTERIRICIHSYNTKSEIDLLVNTIKLSI